MPIKETLLCAEAPAIMDIADMIRQEGHRIYGNMGAQVCAYQASLCGVTAGFGRSGEILTLRAHDLHVDITLSAVPAPVDTDDLVERKSDVITQVSTQYIKGNVDTLAVWHRHLIAYRRSMRSSHAVAA